MAMTMPNVMDCNETDCAYNLKKKCHALAITVGGEEECPMCDTEIKAAKKGGVTDAIGGVGACKVDDCLHKFYKFLFSLFTFFKYSISIWFL